MPSPQRVPRELEGLLRELGPQIRRGAPPAAERPRCATGLTRLDALLSGGFPRGGLSEVTGVPGSGRTSLALATLARATGRGEVTAVVDAADHFDPPSAAAAGVDLTRVLWVRAPCERDALRAVHPMLTAGGFGVVLVDLTGCEARLGARIWPRLRKEVAASDTALIVLADRRIVHTFADVALELAPGSARFTAESGAEGAGTLLLALEGRAELVRSRQGPEPRSIPLETPPALASG
jgi:hypothetical protein